MGRIITPKYRLEIKPVPKPGRDGFYEFTAQAWEVKTKGKPTAANIEKYIRAFVESQKIGGCNEHLARSAGFIQVPNCARIVRQSDGQVVAEWRAPMFMAI
jgi:hypothetical protein